MTQASLSPRKPGASDGKKKKKKPTSKVETERFWEEVYRENGAVKPRPLRKLDAQQNAARETVLAFVRALKKEVLQRLVSVPIPGLGLFYPSKRKGRVQLLPNGKRCNVPATVSVRFRPWMDSKIEVSGV